MMWSRPISVYNSWLWSRANWPLSWFLSRNWAWNGSRSWYRNHFIFWITNMKFILRTNSIPNSKMWSEFWSAMWSHDIYVFRPNWNRLGPDWAIIRGNWSNFQDTTAFFDDVRTWNEYLKQAVIKFHVLEEKIFVSLNMEDFSALHRSLSLLLFQKCGPGQLYTLIKIWRYFYSGITNGVDCNMKFIFKTIYFIPLTQLWSQRFFISKMRRKVVGSRNSLIFFIGLKGTRWK